MSSQPFYTSEIKLSDNVGISSDEKGNLLFTDCYISEILGLDSISLRDILTKIKGIYVKDGKIYFKDDSISRPYSLEEIVGICRRWRKNLSTGSLWWLGRSETDHYSCSNIPEKNNQSVENRLWSVDRFLSVLEGESLGVSSPLTFYEKTKDQTTGEWKWWDIPGVEIVVPPIEDNYKLALINCKLSYASYDSPNPIVFRLYDQTSGKELTKATVLQGNSHEILYPVNLTYFGNLEWVDRSLFNNSVFSQQVYCSDGNDNCRVSDIGIVTSRTYPQGSHLIKAQFHVINYQSDHWSRVFGHSVDSTNSAPSSLDCLIFDVNPNAKFTRKHGTIDFKNEKEKTIQFTNALVDTNYSINLSSNKNVNLWYENKGRNGFVIKSEIQFSGTVDWTIINLNSNNG